MVLDIFERASRRHRAAENILKELRLLQKWERFGNPAVVGAYAHGLLVSPDIDIEIVCPRLEIADGFQVLSECARNPRVKKTRYANELDGRDKALYWQIRYLAEDGIDWKIDMWTFPEDYHLPTGRNLVEPLRKALNPEFRRAILTLKESLLDDGTLKCPSVYLYQAVIDDGVRRIEELREWLRGRDIEALSSWRPPLTP